MAGEMKAEAEQIPLYPSDLGKWQHTETVGLDTPPHICAFSNSINTGHGSSATAAGLNAILFPHSISGQPLSQQLGCTQHMLPKNTAMLTRGKRAMLPAKLPTLEDGRPQKWPSQYPLNCGNKQANSQMETQGAPEE